ncbi:MAG TPA: hypothetical protein VH594_22645 [Trebonia sp.]|jgi:hypothetical protein
MTLSRLSRPARTEAAALAVAAIGIVIQIIGGVNYPAVPPGLIILLAAAALVAFLPWRWAPVFGVLAGAFMVIGAIAAANARYDLSHPGHPGAFIGTWIQLIAVVIAVVAGVMALAVRNQRLARA